MRIPDIMRGNITQDISCNKQEKITVYLRFRGSIWISGTTDLGLEGAKAKVESGDKLA